MKMFFYSLGTILILLILNSGVFGAEVEPLQFKNGKLEISYQDHLKHEFYWWPSTLLSYPVEFDTKVNFDQLVLIDKKNGKQVPFQISEISESIRGKKNAVVNFITDLPSGGSFNYVLKPGNPENFDKIHSMISGNELIVKTDKISVWIPTFQDEIKNQIPGPITGISQLGKGKMGISQFNSGQKIIRKIESKIINEGPIFIETELRYIFEDNSIYQANIRCIKTYDFVELKEKITGFKDQEKCSWTIDWDNFNPTHRQAPNHPYGRPKKNEEGFSRYDWETIGQNMLNSHHGITFSGNNGKIPFEVGTYGNWPAEGTVTSSLFWDKSKMQSVGAFTQNIAFWDDQEYAIWHSSGKINIKFYYKDNKLTWYYPVFSGRRSSAISCYSHQHDIDFMNELENLSKPRGSHPRTKISQLSYNTFLQNRYSTIALNRVKGWDLTYPKSKKLSAVIFKKDDTSVTDLEKTFLRGGYSCELAISGPCQNSGYSPVPARSFYEHYTPLFNTLLAKANEDQRERLSAMFLLHAYMAAGEEYMPMKTMLSGHPNFLADVKGIPALAAFLFPEHPEAKNWGDLYEKYVDLNTRYHIRPEVTAWNATGGRWTENVGAYTWAFLRPTIRSNFLLKDHWDGKNRFASERTKMLGNFVLNTLSAPFNGEDLDFYRDDKNVLDKHTWGVVTPQKGPARVHPPQGAHALRRRPPSVFWRVGENLKYYDPLLSENIQYISRPDHDDMEAIDRKKEIFKIMYPETGVDKGTPPDFKSGKYTGYGIILRAAVGTKDELSVHLQQIDNGPNYRWGLAADGGCGTVYFFARGKSYSHNGKEDIGDRRVQDTDMITNFGAFKDGRFKSIGKGDLTRPFYDFNIAQFAEVVSSKVNDYSWPQYQGRSIMLVGSDYFMIYDDVYNQNMSTRFSWFTHPNEDLPEIKVIKGGGANYTASKKKPKFSTHFGSESKGIWYDGTGDFLTFVSHKKGFTQTQTDFGCVVDRPDGFKDYIFRNDNKVTAVQDGFVFEGTAGLIRQNQNNQEWALFHGNRIGNDMLEISTSKEDAGLCATFINEAKLFGEYFSNQTSEFILRWKKNVPVGIKIYLDGKEIQYDKREDELAFSFPAGKHIWTVTKGQASLKRPSIVYTHNDNKKVEVGSSVIDGAANYLVEYSLDGVNGWQKIVTGENPKFLVKSVGSENKAYIRITASNSEFESEPSVVYPVYFTSEKPHYPDGLKLNISEKQFDLSWGQVLGCSEYKLYRKLKGNSQYKVIYKGVESRFIDEADINGSIYEYAVSSVNGNGESRLSSNVNNDPDSWLNFDPVPGEPFRRSNSHWRRSDNFDNEVGMYYPE